MIAFNKQWLVNKNIQQQLDEAVSENCLSKTEADAAALQHATGFYSPNIFIRIGLYILTIIIAGFSFGLLALIFVSGSSSTAVGGLSIFFGIVCYALLEFMVQSKNHYQSGVDDALLLLTGIAVISGINMITDISSSINALLILIFAVYGAVRFADSLMAFTAVIALLAFVFFSLAPMGSIAKAILPFILMFIAAVLYFINRPLSFKEPNKYYKQCLKIIEITALVCFYTAGNYYVVRETGKSFFHLQMQSSNSFPFAWLFWIFTVSIPPLYIAWGILKKDIILIRVGLLLVAATVFTIRYYYSALPAETVMIIAGILLIAVPYVLIKLLKQPRAGFTAKAVSTDNEDGLKNIEALIIAETLSPMQEQPSTRFGGGSFGGGGATSDF